MKPFCETFPPGRLSLSLGRWETKALAEEFLVHLHSGALANIRAEEHLVFSVLSNIVEHWKVQKNI